MIISSVQFLRHYSLSVFNLKQLKHNFLFYLLTVNLSLRSVLHRTSTITKSGLKAISASPSNTPPMIDLVLQPLNHSWPVVLRYSDGANLVSKPGMHYYREAEHHLVFQLHNLKTFDKKSTTSTLSDEFIEWE